MSTPHSLNLSSLKIQPTSPTSDPKKDIYTHLSPRPHTHVPKPWGTQTSNYLSCYCLKPGLRLPGVVIHDSSPPLSQF